MHRFLPASGLFVMFLLAALPALSATTGRVFFDRDGDGRFSAGETGLAEVAVSDGVSVVQTEPDGTYALEPAAGAPYVFVVLPRGYRTAGRFYVEAGREDPADFALIKWPESRADAIRLAQISDTHVVRGDNATFIEDIREINALTPPAAFVLATGDLVNVGNQEEQLQAYVEGMEHFRLPLFNLPGNHDVKDAEGLAHYHRYLGPDYYSFNAGNCHFVLLNSLRYNEPAQQEWLRRDLAAAPAGATLVFAMHFLPRPEQLEFMAGLGAKAVLSGHWHGHRAQEEQGVFDLNAPPLRFGGIDRHPRSFRLVEIADGKVHNELRLGGFRQHAAVVSPAGEVRPSADGHLPVVINAYDTRTAIEGVVGELDGHTVSLQQTGPWSWSGTMPVDQRREGEQRITARIRAANGETWETAAAFRLADGTATEPTPGLRLKWAAPTGGFIGVSSAQAGRDSVIIGTDDSGDLHHCGVAAFGHDGRERWHFHTDSGIKNHVAVADGRVFATSVAGWLYALDEVSGRLLWKAPLDRDRQARWEVTATTVAEDVVHVGSFGYIAAFDAASGRRIWEARHAPSGDWTPNSYAVPTVVQGKLLLPNLRYALLALDAATGALAWRVEGRFTSCAVEGDTVFALHNGAPTALALHTGERRWTGADRMDASASVPRLAGDRLVVGGGDGRVCALSSSDGRIVWSYQTGRSLTSLEPYRRGGSDVNSSPAIHNGRVYIGASDGRLHVIALADGTPLATYDLGTPIASSPLIVGDTLYVGGYDGNLYAFSLQSFRIPRSRERNHPGSPLGLIH